MNNYSDDYINWKSWTFGALTSSQYKIFVKTLKLTGNSFPPKSKVLEVGFGSGNFLKFARLNSWITIGTEVNKQLISLAKKQMYEVYNAQSFIPEAGSFDLIVAFDLLEHLKKDEIKNFFIGCKHHLKNGGTVICRFPNGDSPYGLFLQNGDFTHVTSIGSGMIKQFANLSNLKIHYLGGDVKIYKRKNFFGTLRRVISYALKKLSIISSLFFFTRKKIIHHEI